MFTVGMGLAVADIAARRDDGAPTTSARCQSGNWSINDLKEPVLSLAKGPRPRLAVTGKAKQLKFYIGSFLFDLMAMDDV